MCSTFDHWAYWRHMLSVFSMCSPCIHWVFWPLSPVSGLEEVVPPQVWKGLILVDDPTLLIDLLSRGISHVLVTMFLAFDKLDYKPQVYWMLTSWPNVLKSKGVISLSWADQQAAWWQPSGFSPCGWLAWMQWVLEPIHKRLLEDWGIGGEMMGCW